MKLLMGESILKQNTMKTNVKSTHVGQILGQTFRIGMGGNNIYPSHAYSISTYVYIYIYIYIYICADTVPPGAETVARLREEKHDWDHGFLRPSD